jgi:hypothetical protein
LDDASGDRGQNHQNGDPPLREAAAAGSLHPAYGEGEGKSTQDCADGAGGIEERVAVLVLSIARGRPRLCGVRSGNGMAAEQL